MPNYFSHDSNARNDEKLIRLRIRHKAAGYGVYFMLLEILREKKDFLCPRDYNVIAYELREDAALVKSVIEEFGLFEFTEDGKFFYSESFLDRMEKVSAARRAAANSRWHPEGVTQQQIKQEITRPNNNETTQSKRTDKRRASNVPAAVTKAATGKF